MKKVKIFTWNLRYELEKEINEFLTKHEIVDIKFSIGSNLLYSVLIIYLEWNKYAKNAREMGL